MLLLGESLTAEAKIKRRLSLIYSVRANLKTPAKAHA
jgi:hypothetical protein